MKTSDDMLVKDYRADGEDGTAKNLYDLLIAGIKNIYYTEQELTKAIPKMVEKATSQDLKSALLKHLEETKSHVKRLEKIFAEKNQQPVATKCVATDGLIKAAEGTMAKAQAGNVLDAAIIGTGQKVEHFEIATYGTLLKYAQILGERQIEEYLEQTLDEEKEADQKLTDVGKRVNVDADTSENGTNEKQAYV